jgi:hypothetical protein
MFPFQISPRPRERRLVHLRMREVLGRIEELEEPFRRPGDVPIRGGDADFEAAGSAPPTSELVELRSQLLALMQHALELEGEIGEVDPALAARAEAHLDAMRLDPTAEADSAGGSPSDLTLRMSDGTTPAAGITVEAPELTAEANGERRHAEAISIRVLPPRAADSPDGASELTIVFDVGPHQVPLRVTLPIETRFREQPEGPPVPIRTAGLKPLSVAVAGIATLVLIAAVWLTTAMWQGFGGPRAATATSQAQQPPAPVAIAAPTIVGTGESRALRESPSVRGPVVGHVPNGTQVEVLDGAEYADGYYWLRVKTADGRVGWLASAARENSPGDLP